MTDYEILLMLKEQYESTQDSSNLKLLIDTFLDNFPVINPNDDVKNNN
ncbi:Uncharacterised protein [Niallia circulans]|jgi:hypothetical protein|nr:hypothetical protein [Niallia circulans]MED4242322.1 hypothetical protein [Niallia circulans]MED4250972.1 hypothetical protein [Niallia circulans]QKH62316.1 hypothetical protein FOC77_17525 [Niallia circulans]SPT86146.1 Uncharacterised protein [Niallia circulans]